MNKYSKTIKTDGQTYSANCKFSGPHSYFRNDFQPLLAVNIGIVKSPTMHWQFAVSRTTLIFQTKFLDVVSKITTKTKYLHPITMKVITRYSRIILQPCSSDHEPSLVHPIGGGEPACPISQVIITLLP